jgi:hypothetical protein
MTVAELVTLLQMQPADAEVRVQFDINDHDTTWALVAELRRDRDAVVLVAA